MIESVLKANQISLSFDNHTILSSVSFELFDNEYVGLIGSNGSGKSTLMRALLGLTPVNAGDILMYGTPLKQFRDWHKVGYVPQKSNFHNQSIPITIEEIISSGYKSISGFSKEEAITSAIEFMGLKDYINTDFGKLSSGLQQRVMVAQAIVNRPKLLFLDEPTNTVDLEHKQQTLEYFERINQEFKTTILHITHDLSSIPFADRILCIDNVQLCEYSQSHTHIQA